MEQKKKMRKNSRYAYTVRFPGNFAPDLCYRAEPTGAGTWSVMVSWGEQQAAVLLPDEVTAAGWVEKLARGCVTPAGLTDLAEDSGCVLLTGNQKSSLQS